MKSTLFVFSDNDSLAQLLKSSEFNKNAENAKSVLFQIFSSRTDISELECLINIIKSDIPSAVIVGSTAAGGILEGSLYKEAIIISITFFDNTFIKPIITNCIPGDELESGRKLIKEINESSSDIAGVLLLATPLTLNISEVLEGVSSENFSYPFFGGGTGVYNSPEHSVIFCGSDFYSQNVIALIFISTELHIFVRPFFGWNSLSKEMTITETDGLILKKIDDSCAFDTYKKYLDLQNDNDFFNNVLEFPFLLQRDGHVVARVPYYSDKNGNLKFLSDLKNGEKLYIGYADPVSYTQELKSTKKDMTNFKPEAIFMFICVCRLYQLHKNIEHEIKPFNSIAPTVGYYTYGEFYSQDNKVLYQNSTIVLVGMREGGKIQKAHLKGSQPNHSAQEPKNKVIPKFVQLVKAVSSDFEQNSKELTRVSAIDKLTQILNKAKLDTILRSEIGRSRRYHTQFSLILLETDNFDEICNNFGLSAAVNTQVQLVRILKKNLRSSDSLGRIENTKFLIILPETSLEKASLAAEKLRAIINKSDFDADHITCGMGITTYYDNDDYEMMLTRAKNALMTAKESGKSKIVTAKITEPKTPDN